MEFSFFLVIVTVLFFGAFVLLKPLEEILIKNRILQAFFCVLPIAFLLINREAAFFLFVLAAVILIFTDFGLYKRFSFTGLELFFALILLLFCILYLPMDAIWIKAGVWFENILDSAGLLKESRFMDVYYAAMFFRNIYPSVLAGFFVYLFYSSMSENKISLWRRYYNDFNHWEIYPAVFFWTVYLLAEYIRLKWIPLKVKEILLCMAVYFSIFYAIFGFLVLLFFFKKKRIQYVTTIIVVYAALVFSGQYFIPVFFLITGIGISDIWMKYRKTRKFIETE